MGEFFISPEYSWSRLWIGDRELRIWRASWLGLTNQVVGLKLRVRILCLSLGFRIYRTSVFVRVDLKFFFIPLGTGFGTALYVEAKLVKYCGLWKSRYQKI
jgi:hypothetical protein